LAAEENYMTDAKQGTDAEKPKAEQTSTDQEANKLNTFEEDEALAKDTAHRLTTAVSTRKI
jgi:hypothetical protein